MSSEESRCPTCKSPDRTAMYWVEVCDHEPSGHNCCYQIDNCNDSWHDRPAADTEAERKAFEQWAKGEMPAFCLEPGMNSYVETAWQAWLARSRKGSR